MKIHNQISFRVTIAASLMLAGTIVAASQGQRTAGDERVMVNTDLVTLSVSVTNAEGQAIPGLEKSAFTVFDNKSPQTISFFSDDDAPASIAIVFDTSGSMSGRKIARAKEALADFIQTGHEQAARWRIVSFISDPFQHSSLLRLLCSRQRRPRGAGPEERTMDGIVHIDRDSTVADRGAGAKRKAERKPNWPLIN